MSTVRMMYLKKRSRSRSACIDESGCHPFPGGYQEGVTGMDEDLADLLRRTDKKVFLVVNKVDNNKISDEIYDFHRLGFESVFGFLLPAEAEPGIFSMMW